MSHKITSRTVSDTIDKFNALGSITKRVTLNWIKAHNNHVGNDMADKLAVQAANCTEEMIHVPISNKLFKNHVKTAIYAEWIKEWNADNKKFKHTKEFFPIMDPKRSKSLLKLKRSELKMLIEIITGHNNFRCFSDKIKALRTTAVSYTHLTLPTIYSV